MSSAKQELDDFVFGFLDEMKAHGNPEFESMYIGSLRNNVTKYKRSRNVVRVLDAIWRLIRVSAKQPSVLFVGDRFASLTKYVGYDLRILGLVTGLKDRKTFFKLRLPYLSANAWVEKLLYSYDYDIYSTRPIDHDSVESIIYEIQQSLVLNRIRLIVLYNDSLFLERAISVAAKRTNIPTIVIQHGIFQAKNAPINDGRYCDVMLVWGDYFRNMYIRAGLRDESNTIILGYPHPQNMRNRLMKHKKLPTVCILGQPLEKLSEKYLQGKNYLVTSLMDICGRLHVNIVYRPHPGEIREELKKAFPDIELTDAGERLEEAIEKYQVFFSINSTALIEASLGGKVSVQVKVPDIPSDDLEKLGVCYAVNLDKEEMTEFIRGFLDGRILPTRVSKDYVEYHEDIGKRFTEIVMSIIGTKMIDNLVGKEEKGGV